MRRVMACGLQQIHQSQICCSVLSVICVLKDQATGSTSLLEMLNHPLGPHTQYALFILDANLVLSSEGQLTP